MKQSRDLWRRYWESFYKYVVWQAWVWYGLQEHDWWQMFFELHPDCSVLWWHIEYRSSDLNSKIKSLKIKRAYRRWPLKKDTWQMKLWRWSKKGSGIWTPIHQVVWDLVCYQKKIRSKCSQYRTLIQWRRLLGYNLNCIEFTVVFVNIVKVYILF